MVDPEIYARLADIALGLANASALDAPAPPLNKDG